MSEPATAVTRSPQLTSEFEELLREGDADRFLRGVAASCAGAAHSPWEVLAVVDQLYRRGRIAPQLFRLARIGIERRALGFQENVSARAVTPVAAAGGTTPVPTAAQVELDAQRLRAELAQSRLEAAGHRQRVQQLEQQLQQVQPREPQPTLPPAAVVAPTPASSPARSRPEKPTGGMTLARFPRHLWLLGGCVAVALAAVLLAVRSGGPGDASKRPSESQALVVPAAPAATAAAPPPAQPGTLSLEQDRYVVGPADAQVVITLRRTGGTDGDIEIEWRAVGGGARPGKDFTVPAHATLALAAGQDAAQIVIPILRNAERRHTEYFDVRLVRGTGGAQLGEVRGATVFLLPGAGGARAAGARRATG